MWCFCCDWCGFDVDFLCNGWFDFGVGFDVGWNMGLYLWFYFEFYFGLRCDVSFGCDVDFGFCNGVCDFCFVFVNMLEC